MIKSEQSSINGYGNVGSSLSSHAISIPGGGMATMNNGAGDDGVSVGMQMVMEYILHGLYR